ncbi:MAG: glycosyltransferase family 2 protein [Pyramidobacter sp.]
MITILMAVWNGEKYLAAQLDSLFSQTVQDFCLYVSDDGSSDGTMDILEQYRCRHPDRMFVCRNATGRHGAMRNFFSLMTVRRDDYLMLCDQDDVWLPRKIELTLAKMRGMEQQYGKSVPLLVHTDLKIADRNLNVLCSSYRAALNANYSRTALKDALIQNIITGCAAMYNRALADLITEEPARARMHDWWLMLIAAAFGAIGHVDEPLILYRQHGNNSIGAEDMRTLSYKLRRLFNGGEVKKAIDITYPQAQSFLDIYRDRLSPQQTKLLEQYIEIPSLPKWKRVQRIYQLGTYKNSLARQIGHILFI